MQLRDPALLISIVGIPAKQLDRVLKQEVNTYTQATSAYGLSCIRQYWDAHCSTLPKLPAIALLDQTSCPRGISDADFVALLTRLTDWQKWQIWDLWTTFNIHNCGFVGCQEFTLLVVLMCAAMSDQQLHAVHAFSSTLHRVFSGANAANAMAGLLQCCQLLGLPYVCLDTAVRQLQVDLLQIDARRRVYKQHSRDNCIACCACSNSRCRQSSSTCCPCSSCSCRHLGGVQTSWQDSVIHTNSQRACLCSSKAAVIGGHCSSKRACLCSRTACCSGSSSSSSSRSCCGNSSFGMSYEGCSSKAEAAAAAGEAASCNCNPSSWKGICEQDFQLVLYCTVHLTHDPLYFISSNAPASEQRRSKETPDWCCTSCMRLGV